MMERKDQLLEICVVFIDGDLATGSLANYLYGLKIGFKGSKLPSNPVFGVAFLVVAAIFFAAAYFVKRKSEEQKGDQA